MRLKAIYITLFLLFTGCSSSNNKTTPPETGKDDVKSTPHTRPSYSSNPCSIDNRKVKEDIENGKPYIIIQRHPEETGIKVTYKNIRNIRFTADVNSENNNWRITFDDKPALNSILSIKCFYKQKQEFSTALQKEYINRKKIITRLKSFSKLLKIGNPQNIKSEAMKISTDFKQLSVTDFVYPEITSDGTNIKINENCEVYNTGLNIIDEDFKKISKCLEQNFIPDLENKMKTFKKSFCGEYNFSLDKYTNKIVCSKRSFSKVSFKNDEKKIDRDMIKFTSGLVFSDTYCNGENLFRYIGVNNLKNNCYTAAIIPFLASFAPFGGHRNAGEDLDGFWNNLKYRFKIDIGIGIKSIFQKPDPRHDPSSNTGLFLGISLDFGTKWPIMISTGAYIFHNNESDKLNTSWYLGLTIPLTLFINEYKRAKQDLDKLNAIFSTTTTTDGTEVDTATENATTTVH